MTCPDAAAQGSASRRAWLRGAALSALGAGLASGLTACGFRLRGTGLRMPFDRLRLNVPTESELVRDLRLQLQAAGVEVVGAVPPGRPAVPPDAVLDILQDQREREVVGTTAAGQVRELQLRYRVRYQLRTVAGRELVGPTELLQERDLSFSETQVLGKEMEEALLYRDMQSALVRQLMTRLAAVKRG